MKLVNLIQLLVICAFIYSPNRSILFAQSNPAITPCILSMYPNAGNCDIVDNPFVYSGDCTIGINRLISRMASAHDLDNFIQPGPCYTAGGIDPLPANSNCTPPYNLCSSGGCDTAYCKAIQSFITLKASFLSRAFNIWGDEWSFYIPNSLEPDGGKSYKAAKQIVIDINASFDCAGLPRPVIQGSVFEAIPTAITLPLIPSNIISSFQDSIIGAGEYSYYFDPIINKPKTTIHFNKARMLLPISGNSQYLDLTKIETQLWFYYLATIQIDLGYTALHMGQPSVYASNDAPNYNKLYFITKKIRDYAKSKIPATFVLLNPENGIISSSYKWNGTEQLIFDFDGRAMRPLEYSYESVNGEGSCNGPAEIGPFNASPCNEEDFPAVIDPCIIESFGGSGGGISPSGCTYQTVPYFIYFDFGSGILIDSASGPCAIDSSVGTPSAELTWGYEDTRWFAEQLSDECKLAWFESMYCSIRNILGGNGFVQIPALLGIGFPEVVCDTIPPYSSEGKYLMQDNEMLTANFSDFMEPSEPDILISEACLENETSIGFTCDCDGYIPPRHRAFKLWQKEYTFSVENPDCSSTYSWHIKNSTGQWDPQTFGQERKFRPPYTGYYTIILRQDNLGIEPYSPTFGVNNVVIDSIYLTRTCCNHNSLPILNYYCDSIRSSHTDLEWIVFPSPFNNEVTIESDFGEDFYAIIRNNLGQFIDKKLFTKGEDRTLNLENISDGIYILSIINADNREVLFSKMVVKSGLFHTPGIKNN